MRSLLWVQLHLAWQNKLAQGQFVFASLSVYPHLWAKVSLTVQSKGAGEPFSDQSERLSSVAQGAEAGSSPLFPQAAGPEDLRGHPAPGCPALGAGPVPPARLGLRMRSSEGFIMSDLAFRSLTQFLLIFVDGVKVKVPCRV